MIDPCFDSVMDPLIINDMMRSVKESSTSQSLSDVADIVSKTFGNQDGLTYCGPRIVELTTDPALYSSFLSFDQVNNVLTVQTDHDADIGVYPIEAKVSLVNYPLVSTNMQFTVEIIYCQVTDMD